MAQISAPAGYIAYTDSVEVTLASGQQGELTLANLQSENTSGLGRLIVYSNVSSEFGGGRIAGAEYEVEDNFGEKWTGTTNANGELIFTGLPVTGRTYQLRQISVPYEYNTLSNPVVQKGITFAPVEFTTTVNVYNDKRDTRDLAIYVHETGDSLIPIAGAEIKVVRTFDGAEFFGTTGEDGRVVFTLLTGDYTFSQLTSDADHIKSEDITSVHLMRYYERLIPNDLIDPTSPLAQSVLKKCGAIPRRKTSPY